MNQKIKVALAGAALAGAVGAYHAIDFPAPGQAAACVSSPCVTPSPIVSPSALGVVLDPVTNATAEEELLIEESELVLRETIVSECFGQFMLARALIHDGSANGTNGLSNSDVLAHIRAAAGKIPVTVYHQPWYKPSSVMGYRNVGETLIHLRDTSLTSVCDTASLEAHESIGHVLGGWDHDFRATAARPFSVPYSINAGFDACCKAASQ